MIRLSIITINYNNRDGLQRTFQSVFGQSYLDFQYIVIDGDSCDGSCDLIIQNSDKIDYWVSEPDNGIYHAMNKGISVADGEYCLFLNSGDELIGTNVLSKNIGHLFSEDVICFDSVIRGSTDTLTQHPEIITLSFLWNSTLCHQSTFIRTGLFIGNPYDDKLRIVADWKFFIVAFLKRDATYRKVNDILTLYHSDGISSNPENYNSIDDERNLVLQNEFYPIFGDMNELRNLKSTINLLRSSRKIKILQQLKLIKIF